MRGGKRKNSNVAGIGRDQVKNLRQFKSRFGLKPNVDVFSNEKESYCAWVRKIIYSISALI